MARTVFVFNPAARGGKFDDKKFQNWIFRQPDARRGGLKKVNLIKKHNKIKIIGEKKIKKVFYIRMTKMVYYFNIKFWRFCTSPPPEINNFLYAVTCKAKIMKFEVKKDVQWSNAALVIIGVFCLMVRAKTPYSVGPLFGTCGLFLEEGKKCWQGSVDGRYQSWCTCDFSVETIDIYKKPRCPTSYTTHVKIRSGS